MADCKEEEKIIWDWKSGFCLYFGKFYNSLSHPIKNCLEHLEELWQLVYEYQYERAIEPGFYAPTLDGKTPLSNANLRYFVVYQNVSKTCYYLHKTKTGRGTIMISPNDAKIQISPPSSVQNALGFSFGFYQFTAIANRKKLIGYISWCGKFLHMQFQQAQVQFYMNCLQTSLEFGRAVDYE